MMDCHELSFVLIIILAITPLRVVSPRRVEGPEGKSVRILPIEVGRTHPYRLQLTPPLVYCSFPLAALNMEPEIDRFLGAVDPIGAEPEFSGGLCVPAKIRS